MRLGADGAIPKLDPLTGVVGVKTLALLRALTQQAAPSFLIMLPAIEIVHFPDVAC